MKSFAITNQHLFIKIKSLVQEERRIGVEILECLYLIEQRKAYAELKYDGLFTYCVKELGFTDSQAYQRIQAMRALKELPELKSKIASGSLNVTSVSKAQAHFKKQKKEGILHSKGEKLALFDLLENQTSKQVDQTLLQLRGETLKTELHLELDSEAEYLWDRVKDLSAHKTQCDQLEILKMLMRDWVRKNDPLQSQARRSVPSSTQVAQQNQAETKSPSTTVSSTSSKLASTSSSPGLTFKKPNRFIPAHLRRTIWKRDQGKCTNCHSRHAIEIDHIKPVARGGTHTEGNLRLLCYSCNLSRAIQEFGEVPTKRVRSAKRG